MSRSMKYKKGTGNIGFATRMRQFWNNSLRNGPNSRKKPLRLSDIHHWDEPGFESMLNKAIILGKAVHETGTANGGHDGTDRNYNLHAEVRDIGGQTKKNTERLRAMLEPTTETVLKKPLVPPVPTDMMKLSQDSANSYFVQSPWNDIRNHREIYILDESAFSRREARFYRLADQKRKWFFRKY
ncbi:hypothetical protein ScPMuIL_015294 [Solemya velum]